MAVFHMNKCACKNSHTQQYSGLYIMQKSNFPKQKVWFHDALGGWVGISCGLYEDWTSYSEGHQATINSRLQSFFSEVIEEREETLILPSRSSSAGLACRRNLLYNSV